ncbi:uncharacterized protein LOC107037453 isoform X3 [Diachasma alloeum]|uniref:uncharacterized protein LOC107037453 isoform X3 n=1 Tax=Diachasma alloeum TaxID=454923 RepID=UPI0007381A54|nr:uncharacterized protein LOC107037453 isoform X3 [Diachasma alloeum]
MSRITYRCKRAMLDYMKKNKDFAFGRLKDSGFNSKAKMKRHKEEFANTVNAASNGTMNKDGDQAMRSWTDWKKGVLIRAARLRSHAKGTGGGDPLDDDLDTLEKELLDFLGPESYSIPNIEEGGFPSRHSSSTRGNEPPQKKFRTGNNRTVRTVNCTSGGYNPVTSFAHSTHVPNKNGPTRSLNNLKNYNIQPPVERYERSSFDGPGMNWLSRSGKDNGNYKYKLHTSATFHVISDEEENPSYMHSSGEEKTYKESDHRHADHRHADNHHADHHRGDTYVDLEQLDEELDQEFPDVSAEIGNYFPEHYDNDVTETWPNDTGQKSDETKTKTTTACDPAKTAVELLENKMEFKKEESEATVKYREQKIKLEMQIFDFEKEKFRVEGQRHEELVSSIKQVNDTLVALLQKLP